MTYKPLSSQPPILRAGEIDLLLLIQALWRERLLILGCTLATLLLAGVYLLWAPKTYEVRSIIKPASIRNLDQLNRSGIYPLSREEALHKIETELSSYATRLEYLERNPELLEPLRRENESFEQTFARFNQTAFKVLKPDPKNGPSIPYTGLSLKYPESIDGVTLLNGFVDYVRAREREQIQSDVTEIINNRITFLKGNINAATAGYEFRKNAQIAKLQEDSQVRQKNLEDELAALMRQLEIHRQNRITQLDEAIRIARQLNIHNPSTLSSVGERFVQEQPRVIHTEINNQQLPLYFMGVNALTAERKMLTERRSDTHTTPRIAEIRKELYLLQHNREIEALKNRENEELFLENMAQWTEELTQLGNLQLNFQSLRLVREDERALPPLQPASPKKLLILALALVMGGILGALAAFFRIIFRQHNASAGSSDGKQSETPRDESDDALRVVVSKPHAV